MLSAEKFIAGMTLLKKNYIGWQFDTKDEIQVKLWYSAFKNLTDERFNELIKDYIANNEYPPKCIKNLTDIYVDRQIQFAKIPPEKALDHVRNVISDCGGWEYGGKAEIYKSLAKYPALYETVKEFEDTIKNMPAKDTYAADRFRKAYEQRLRTSAAKKVNEFLGITTSNTQALGSAALPYEV